MINIQNNNGFTLVETIIVIVILGIVVAIGAASITTAADALAFLTVRADMDQSADAAMGRISEEIVRLKDDTSISTASATQFSFTDVDDTLITYSLSGTDLMRTTLASSDILASNVASIAFSYYDDSDTELAIPGDIVLSPLTNIRRIQVLLTFQIGASYEFNYQTQIRPRNLRHLSYKFK